MHEHAVASASAKMQSVRPNGEGERVGGGSGATAPRDHPRGWRVRRRRHSGGGGGGESAEGSRAGFARRWSSRGCSRRSGRWRRPCRRRRRGSRRRDRRRPSSASSQSRRRCRRLGTRPGPATIVRTAASPGMPSGHTFYHDFGVVPSASKHTPGPRGQRPRHASGRRRRYPRRCFSVAPST